MSATTANPETTLAYRHRSNAVALVTGGTAGIGLATCLQLASTMTVILTSRTAEKGIEAVKTIKEVVSASSVASSVDVSFVVMELSDLASVADACQEVRVKYRRLDYLLLNAGLSNFYGHLGGTIPKTKDGIELTVGVNHVASCFIALKLLPLMEQTGKDDPQHTPPTITFVSSDLHNIHSSTGAARMLQPPLLDESVRYLASSSDVTVDARLLYCDLAPDDPHHIQYHGLWAYKYSKLLNVLAAKALDKRLTANKSPVQCNSMEPGFVPASDLSRSFFDVIGESGTKVLKFLIYSAPLRWLISYMIGQPVRTLREAAQSQVLALTQGTGGTYYRLNQPDEMSPLTDDEIVVDRMWKATLDLLKEKGYDPL